MKHTLASLAFLLLLSACGNNEGNKETPQTQQSAATTGAETLTGNWYRQYQGTIAGKYVVVDLQHTDDKLTGTYTYNGHDMLLDLYADSDSSAAGKYFIFESNPTSRDEENDDHNNAHWLVTFSNGSIAGQWLSQNGQKKYDITLREVDYKSSFSFAQFSDKDSVVVPMKGFTVGAHTEHKWCMPAQNMPAADKEFLTASVLKTLGCKQGQNATDCIKDQNKNYFANYKSQLEEGVPKEQSHMYNHETIRDVSVVYNKNGFVILETMLYEYSGGAHGMHGVGYNCIDVTGKKNWQLADVMTVDTAALIPILEAEARRIFKIPATEAISERLLTDTVKPTNNFLFTSAGITFVYGPYEIASYADGDVYIHIPFSRLSALLTPGFKKRMNLK